MATILCCFPSLLYILKMRCTLTTTHSLPYIPCWTVSLFQSPRLSLPEKWKTATGQTAFSSSFSISSPLSPSKTDGRTQTSQSRISPLSLRQGSNKKQLMHCISKKRRRRRRDPPSLSVLCRVYKLPFLLLQIETAATTPSLRKKIDTGAKGTTV